jgi:hypothetical protein
MAGSFTDFTEDLVLNFLLTTNTANRPTEWYVGLFTTATGETGGGTEVSGGSYTRKAAAFTVSGTDPTSAVNSAAVEFDTATDNWGEITHIGLFDAATSGNMLVHAPLDVAKTIGTGDVFRIPAGDLEITLD